MEKTYRFIVVLLLISIVFSLATIAINIFASNTKFSNEWNYGSAGNQIGNVQLYVEESSGVENGGK